MIHPNDGSTHLAKRVLSAEGGYGAAKHAIFLISKFSEGATVQPLLQRLQTLVLGGIGPRDWVLPIRYCHAGSSHLVQYELVLISGIRFSVVVVVVATTKVWEH